MTPVLLAHLVATASAVAETPARNGKISLLADLFTRLEPGEVAAAAAFLAGEPRQGKIGVGWAAAYRVEPAHATTPSVTVLDVDRALDELRDAVGKGSQAARAEILGDLFARATEPEAGFVRRLLTGELRQGALEGVVVEAVARAASVPSTAVRRALMLNGDLGATAWIALSTGVEGLGAVRLEVLRPVQPMLASVADDVAGALAVAGRASVEWKLDGIRVQVHRAGDEVRVFTRNLNDITARVPEVVGVVRAMPARALVLDGEAIVLDGAERPSLFQETASRMGRRTGEPAVAVAASFFDILHRDGTDLIDLPLAERIAALDEVASPWRIRSIVSEDATEAADFLSAAIRGGHEGVMVKSLSSTYQAGRRGKAWLKVKPVRTLDLVVLGAEWGHGRRRGWLSNLHLGARDPAGGFVMVGKTFKGLTDELLGWQTEQLLARETSHEGIVVWARPELVVEIELDGVQGSTRYPGGVALRFARVLRYRPDKTPHQADTIDAVRAMLPR
jgi:DNA ligase-1